MSTKPPRSRASAPGTVRSTAPVLLDPFAGGVRIEPPAAAADAGEVYPWDGHEAALRMLNNLVGSYTRRNDLGRATRAAELRLKLPLERGLAEALGGELRRLRARLNQAGRLPVRRRLPGATWWACPPRCPP